jgi:hypothetical protein
MPLTGPCSDFAALNPATRRFEVVIGFKAYDNYGSCDNY